MCAPSEKNMEAWNMMSLLTVAGDHGCQCLEMVNIMSRYNTWGRGWLAILLSIEKTVGLILSGIPQAVSQKVFHKMCSKAPPELMVSYYCRRWTTTGLAWSLQCLSASVPLISVTIFSGGVGGCSYVGGGADGGGISGNSCHQFPACI